MQREHRSEEGERWLDRRQMLECEFASASGFTSGKVQAGVCDAPPSGLAVGKLSNADLGVWMLTTGKRIVGRGLVSIARGPVMNLARGSNIMNLETCGRENPANP